MPKDMEIYNDGKWKKSKIKSQAERSGARNEVE